MLASISVARIIPASAGSTASACSLVMGGVDHPRVRGEHASERIEPLDIFGSSPRPRGALARLHNPLEGTRIIPASAGSTHHGQGSTGLCADHPRVRGEHLFKQPFCIHGDGSSPRPRGARSQLRREAVPRGIIPASAGSTVGVNASGGVPKDHPRVRGEHSVQIPCLTRRRGSSPRPRGALLRQARGAQCPGIIPASAGSTDPDLLYGDWVRDHPRVRGEHVDRDPLRHRALRIIPASAGSTPRRPTRTRCTADHPRVRGEHMKPQNGLGTNTGSSPRPRGARDGGVGRRCSVGIIPASAGSTSRPPRGTAGPTDHPRVRGEHCQIAWAHCGDVGSSPRPRGALKSWMSVTARLRIIPASAGSTTL